MDGTDGPSIVPAEVEDSGAVIPEAALARARVDLANLRGVGNPLEIQLRISALINRLLVLAGGSAVVVGGSAVSFYTGGAYLSRDVDIVTEVPGPQIASVLQAIGFARKNGAWIHPEVDVVVDFPASSLAGDSSRVVQVETEEGPIAVIGLEDLLVDRLNAAVHWDDSEAREWCITMLTLHTELDMDYLRSRATNEQITEELEAVLREAR